MAEPSTQVRDELHALPEIPLPDALWQRVDSGRRQKMRRRKAFVGVASLALVAVMAVPLLAPQFIGEDVARSESMAVHQAVHSEQDVYAELRAIDRALQAAYDRGASDAEIAPMWVARNILLADSQPRLAKPKTNRT